MNKKNLIGLVVLVLVVVSFVYVSRAYSNTNENINGIWLGTLKVAGIQLRIVFNILQKQDGSVTATIDSPDQGTNGIPVDSINFKNSTLRIEVKSIVAVFEGKLKPDGSIEGQWTQRGLSFPLIVKKVDKVPKDNRPQTPKKPYPYHEEEVVYENKKAGIKFAGTLTFPNSKGPFPVVLLITGSGSQNRNETIFNHHPFLVLADYLTCQGIAVLRVDDRGVGGSTGNAENATSEDFASDVMAGIDYLKTRTEINPKQIGLIGHSEGGIIAPMVAVQSSDVAFIVMLAGTGLTGEEILYLQGELIAKAVGASDEDVTKSRKLQERLISVIKNEKDKTTAEKKLREILSEVRTPKDAIDVEIKQLLSPWLQFFMLYDPKPALMKVKCPVIAINGEKDLQVPAKENLKAIEDALKAGGNKNYTIKEIPNLNHLFQTAKTGSPTEYVNIEETFSPIALKIIGDWVLEQTKQK